MADSNQIHFILTGGTIDSYYEGTQDTVIPNERSVIPEFIKSLKLYNEVIFYRNMHERQPAKYLIRKKL